MRLSTQELDDVLVTHHGVQGASRLNCYKGCGPWPCLDYRLARDLKAALKVVARAKRDHEEDCNCVEAGEPFERQCLMSADLEAYDTEETQ